MKLTNEHVGKVVLRTKHITRGDNCQDHSFMNSGITIEEVTDHHVYYKSFDPMFKDDKIKILSPAYHDENWDFVSPKYLEEHLQECKEPKMNY